MSQEILTNESSFSLHDSFKKLQGKIDFSIVSPMPEELVFLQKIFMLYPHEVVQVHSFEFKIYEYRKKRILLSHTGLGTTFTASVVTLIHHYFHPDYFLMLGTAGGINPAFNIRDVVIAEKAFEAEIQDAFELLKGTPFESCLTHPLNKKTFPAVYAVDKVLLEIASTINCPSIKVHKGTAMSSNTFPALRALFHEREKELPDSIDMETSAFCQIAWLLNVPALAIRGISNILTSDLENNKIHEPDIEGSTKTAGFILLSILDAVIHQCDSEQRKNTSVGQEAANIIHSLNLKPHPEGGHYAVVFKSTHLVKSTDKSRYHGESRSAGSSIYWVILCDIPLLLFK